MLSKLYEYYGGMYGYTTYPASDAVYVNMSPNDRKRLDDYCWNKFGSLFRNSTFDEQDEARSWFAAQDSGSDDVDEVAVYNTKSPKNVGSKLPNQLGIYDMSGNVWEWCQDEISNDNCRVIRGGSWFNSAGSCHVAQRHGNNASDRNNSIGFRIFESL